MVEDQALDRKGQEAGGKGQRGGQENTFYDAAPIGKRNDPAVGIRRKTEFSEEAPQRTRPRGRTPQMAGRAADLKRH